MKVIIIFVVYLWSVIIFWSSGRTMRTGMRWTVILYQLQQSPDWVVSFLYTSSRWSSKKRGNLMAKSKYYCLARIDATFKTRWKMFEYLESGGLHTSSKTLLQVSLYDLLHDPLDQGQHSNANAYISSLIKVRYWQKRYFTGSQISKE